MSDPAADEIGRLVVRPTADPERDARVARRRAADARVAGRALDALMRPVALFGVDRIAHCPTCNCDNSE